MIMDSEELIDQKQEQNQCMEINQINSNCNNLCNLNPANYRPDDVRTNPRSGHLATNFLKQYNLAKTA